MNCFTSNTNVENFQKDKYSKLNKKYGQFFCANNPNPLRKYKMNGKYFLYRCLTFKDEQDENVKTNQLRKEILSLEQTRTECEMKTKFYFLLEEQRAT